MRQVLEKQKQALIDGLINARRDILETVRALPGDCLDEIFLGSWSIKDLVAHLAGWDFTNRQAVEEILSGQAPTFFQHYDKDWQRYNRMLVEKYRVEPFSVLLAAVEQSHRELIAYLESLSPEVVVRGKASRQNGRSVSIHNLLRSEAWDECKHAEQIKAYFLSAPQQKL